MPTADAPAAAADPLILVPSRPGLLRLLDGLGRAAARLGLRQAPLALEPLMAQATRQTGLSDFGDPAFVEPFRVLIDACEREANLTPTARRMLRAQLVRLLVNRLKIREDLRRHPEILDVPVRRPLFVAGMPRSGTTLLHKLLALDPSARWLRFWETVWPSPPPVAGVADDPRIAQARKLVAALYRLAPALARAHELDPEGAEECNPLFENSGVSIIPTLSLRVPSYGAWLRDQPSLQWAYREFREQVQLLSWRSPPAGHWAFKAPVHTGRLGDLLATFPDAAVVLNHRDPHEVIASLCSLTAMMRGLFSDRVDLRAIGEQILEGIATMQERAIAARAQADPARFLDVRYPDLLRDPIGTVTRIYDDFGYPLDPSHPDRIGAWLAANPQHKHGAHRYDLARYGLDRAAVDARFAAYYAWRDTHLGAPEAAPR